MRRACAREQTVVERKAVAAAALLVARQVLVGYGRAAAAAVNGDSVATKGACRRRTGGMAGGRNRVEAPSKARSAAIRAAMDKARSDEMCGGWAGHGTPYFGTNRGGSVAKRAPMRR